MIQLRIQLQRLAQLLLPRLERTTAASTTAVLLLGQPALGDPCVFRHVSFLRVWALVSVYMFVCLFAKSSAVRCTAMPDTCCQLLRRLQAGGVMGKVQKASPKSTLNPGTVHMVKASAAIMFSFFSSRLLIVTQG